MIGLSRGHARFTALMTRTSVFVNSMTMESLEKSNLKPIRWGIIGSGKIAGRFASDLKFSQQAVLVGVASRDFKNAERFASKHGTRAFSSIDELLKEDIDVIYVATPHPFHMENSLAAIEAGKAVLCEKPFTMDSSEAEKLIAAAKNKNIFLMEAMWTRFFPVIRDVLRLIQSGVIGQVQSIESSFGFTSVFDPNSRVFNKALGGGALLDVGVYCVSFAHMIFGDSPVVTTATAQLGETGIDEMSEWTLTFPNGGIAKGQSSVIKVLKNEAIILGTMGSIRIPDFWHPKEFYLNEVRNEAPYDGLGFQFEANEVMDCLRSGKKESNDLPLEYSLSVMRTIDLIRYHFKSY